MYNKDPIKVGVLFSEKGVTSMIGRSQFQGTLLAVEEINEGGGIDGRELVPISYDAQSSPPLYASLAEQLIIQDKVNVIFGCYMSSSRKAVLPIVEKWNKLLFYPTLYEGFEFSNNIIYTGAAPNQNSVQLAEFMTSNFGASVYLVGSNYIYPYESNRIMRDLVLQRPNSRIMGEQYVPLNATQKDFTPIMKDIRDKCPDFIFSTIVGDSTVNLYHAYAESGFSAMTMPIASLTTSESEISHMGVEFATGHITAATYFQSINSVINTKFIKNLYKKYNEECISNTYVEAAYFQMHMYANAYRQAGSDQIEQIKPSLLGSEFIAPQGRVRINPTNHHTSLYPRIGIANSKGQFTIVREANRPVEPDPYLVTHSLGDWTAVLSNIEL